MGKEVAFEEMWATAGNLPGRGTRIPDLPRLLAVHMARQSAGRTARLMRETDPSFVPGDEPGRLTVIFATPKASRTAQRQASGSFNQKVAACMTMGAEGEDEIYSGS